LYKKILEGKLEFPDYISELSKDLIIKFLNTNPKKRIKLEEIKAHPFFKMGEKQIKKEEAGMYDNETLNEIVLETMSEIGFNREEALRNLNAKKHNNITTTYTLFYHKYKINPTLCETFIKNHENLFKKNSFLDIQSGNANNPNNINININAQNHFGNININILDSSIFPVNSSQKFKKL
jgi:serine/threonine protein kinase